VHRQLFQIRNFIDGKFVEPAGGKYLDNIEPATGKMYAQVADSNSRWVIRQTRRAPPSLSDFHRRRITDACQQLSSTSLFQAHAIVSILLEKFSANVFQAQSLVVIAITFSGLPSSLISCAMRCECDGFTCE
jgi:hypothetical protein